MIKLLKRLFLFLRQLKASQNKEADPKKVIIAEERKMKIAISSGHGLRIAGAVGVLSEVTEARRVVSEVVRRLREIGVIVEVFHDNESTTVTNNINTIVNWHNAHVRDLDISVHFNAFRHTENPMGVEVLYRDVDIKGLAMRISRVVANAGGFRNRGDKHRTDLGFLNRVEKPAILIEVCFVDSAADARLYGDNFDAICKAIAKELVQ